VFPFITQTIETPSPIAQFAVGSILCVALRFGVTGLAGDKADHKAQDEIVTVKTQRISFGSAGNLVFLTPEQLFGTLPPAGTYRSMRP
jgi:hypothetical protein